METNQAINQQPSFFKRNSTQITLKLLMIGGLILGLLIPRFLVSNLVGERKEYNNQVNKEVSKNWSESQNIAGPFLIIPYLSTKTEVINDKNVTTNYKRNLIINPKELNINGNITTDKKYRSLYEVILYTANLDIKGKFNLSNIKESQILDSNLYLNEAFLTFIIGDAKGVQKMSQIKINENQYEFKPSTNQISAINYETSELVPNDYTRSYSETSVENSGNASHGMHTLIPLKNLKDELNFSFKMNLKGSDYISFAPVAKITQVKLTSTFNDPVFNGNFSTDSGTKIDKNGFSVKWTVSEFQRNIPAFIVNSNKVDLQNSNFGVKIKETVDNYSKTERATKYMILIIAMTFLIVFITEIVNKFRVHVFQYTLIGLAIVIFFTLLLSFGEYFSFDISYSIATFSIIGLIVMYSLSVFKNIKSTLTLGISLAGLFLFMFTIIQMEKYSLIVGSIGIFIALAITMFVTRKIKWYEEN